MAGLLIPRGFWSAQTIRFTESFRETITIEQDGHGPSAPIRIKTAGHLGWIVPTLSIRIRSQALAKLVGRHSSRFNSPRPFRAVDDQAMILRDWEFGAPGTSSTGSGNEGVGEHVRIRFHLGKERR